MSYEKLAAHYKKLSELEHLEAIVAWDEAAMMPEGGASSRAEALATLRGLAHEHAAAPVLGAWLEAAATETGLDAWQRANLREMQRSHRRATALPASLVEASSRAESRSEQAWRKLRAENDWATFRPLLETVVATKREVAAVLGDAFGIEPYDALLDAYEPGARSREIAGLFTTLGEFLPGFIARVLEEQKGRALRPPSGPFPIEHQRALGERLMRKLGFDFEHGRLDVSHHPFCGGVPEDVRITTRYDPADFAKALMGVLHETGHAKYEQNLPRAWLAQPVGKARSMSVHESQSLLLEMQVARSREFASFVAPLLAEAFPDSAARDRGCFDPENVFRIGAQVRPGLIRVDADEVTYPCHVVLRYELEQALITGSLAVRELPDAWDAGMRRLLGISTAGDFKNGCMQDVHWPAGLFGYFPTYTLGALTAAQLFAAASRDVSGLAENIARGDLTGLDAWLREKLWGQGSRYETAELIERATGRPLDTEAFQRHLERRYLAGC
jgi:carboxypeptidase Taq